MSEKFLCKISKILNIKFTSWQKHYLLDDKVILLPHISLTELCFCYALKILLNATKPLILDTVVLPISLTGYSKWKYKNIMNKHFRLLHKQLVEHGVDVVPLIV